MGFDYLITFFANMVSASPMSPFACCEPFLIRYNPNGKEMLAHMAFVDEIHPTIYSMDVYPAISKIVEILRSSKDRQLFSLFFICHVFSWLFAVSCG
jgi:hypothetical protein